MRQRGWLWIRQHPAAALALAALAGITLAEYQSSILSVAALVAASGVAILLSLWRAKQSLWVFLATTLVFACVHRIRLDETFLHPLQAHLLQSGPEAQSLTAEMWLSPLPEVTGSSRSIAKGWLKEYRLAGQGKWQHGTTLKVYLPDGWKLQSAGWYEVHGLLASPRPVTNPGQFDGRRFLLRSGFVAELRAHSCVLKKRGDFQWFAWLQNTANASARWLGRQLQYGLHQDAETVGVIQAMALGATDDAEQLIVESFRDSGTLHIFAVSGLHVVLVGGVVMFFLRLLSVRRSVAVLILIPVVFGYAFMTGWKPSAARAALMVALFFGSTMFERQSSLQNSLGVAALILLGHDTHQACFPGFQLSFGVLWAIAFMAGPWQHRLQPWWQVDSFLPPVLATSWQRLTSRMRQEVAAVVTVSGAAWLGSLPFMLWHFQTLTPVALVANCILVPWSFLCMFASCLSVCAAALHATGTLILINHCNVLLTKVLVAMAGWFAVLPGANVQFSFIHAEAPTAVEWQILHLPDGAAASHLRSQSTHWLLDTGNVRHWRYIVHPYLRSRAVDRLNGVILSHNDADHMGAALLAGKTMHPVRLYTSNLEPRRYDPPFSSMGQLVKEQAGGIPWEKFTPHQRIPLDPDGHAYATMLYPGEGSIHDKADDRCLILRIESGPFSMLWMSDAGFLAEKELLARQKNWQCDVLVRNQHASDFSALEEFIEAANPRVIISSNEPRMAEERLPEALSDYCRKKGIQLLTLDQTGSVSVSINAEELAIRALRQETTLRLSPRR